MLFKESRKEIKSDEQGLRIWEKPKAGNLYAIGADVAEGINRDASVAQVIDIKRGIHVASYWSNGIDVDALAMELFKLGTFYNKAEICIEANNHGHAVISHLTAAAGGLAYPYLYKRIIYDEFTQKKDKAVGFKTTSVTKPRIIENLKSALRDGDLVTYDPDTIKELGSFVIDNKSGKMGAKGNAKDDRVMALALAWEQVIQVREFQNNQPSSYSSSQPYDLLTGTNDWPF